MFLRLPAAGRTDRRLGLGLEAVEQRALAPQHLAVLALHTVAQVHQERQLLRGRPPHGVALHRPHAGPPVGVLPTDTSQRAVSA